MKSIISVTFHASPHNELHCWLGNFYIVNTFVYKHFIIVKSIIIETKRYWFYPLSSRVEATNEFRFPVSFYNS